MLSGNPIVAFDVFKALTGVIVYVAIRFDDNAASEADKIGNEGTYWMLAAEAMANDLPFAQNLP